MTDDPSMTGPADHPERAAGGGGVELSVVAPAHNEEGNVRALADEIERAVAPMGVTWEFVLVDDGSTDRTGAIARELSTDRPWLVVVTMRDTPPGKGNGQSAAFHAGFRVARGRWIATLDADLQNDPAEIPKLYAMAQETGADMAQGDRSAARREGDAWIRQVGSIVGRAFRRMLLNDTIRDTGCSLRVMRREIAVRLPLEFRGAHRFIPVTARQMGYTVVEKPVVHRSRHAGETKYGAGVLTRALPGLIDCFAIRWMGSRRRPVTHQSVRGGAGSPESVDASGEATVEATGDQPVAHEPAGRRA